MSISIVKLRQRLWLELSKQQASGSICAVFYRAFKIFMLTAKNDHYNCWWNLIFSFQIWYQSFPLAISSISIRTLHFQFDDSPIWLPTLSKYGACLPIHAVVKSRSPKWNMPRIRCVRNCQIITYLVCSFCQPLHLTQILHLFVIANNIRCLINELWL